MLSEPVISESPHQMTGGGYQTIRLGERVRDGFRLARPNLLPGFELEGKAVCDLGANLGEISRDLRRGGARLVHAYEYDPLFTQLARYITAYNGMTDIDHFQADVSAEGFLRQSYDICVGLSAYSFMQRNIDYICSHTSEQMIIETHEVEEGWYDLYARPIIEHFPHWCCFARVPHSATDSSKWRLWLTFSKRSLMPFYRRRVVSLIPDAEGVVEIDLNRSTLHFPTDPPSSSTSGATSFSRRRASASTPRTLRSTSAVSKPATASMFRCPRRPIGWPFSADSFSTRTTEGSRKTTSTCDGSRAVSRAGRSIPG